jgi:transposase-like protein
MTKKIRTYSTELKAEAVKMSYAEETVDINLVN